jgi:hypothetical protein
MSIVTAMITELPTTKGENVIQRFSYLKSIMGLGFICGTALGGYLSSFDSFNPIFWKLKSYNTNN